MIRLYKNTFTYAAVVFFMLTGAVNAIAQSKNLGALSLQEAISLAQEQSAIADAARFALLSSQYQYKSFRADLLPRLVLTGEAPNFRHSINQILQDDGTLLYREQRQSATDATLKIEQNILWTGGTVSLSSGVSRLGIFNGEDSYAWGSTPLAIGITQPLFQFNSLKWQNKVEPLKLKIAKKDYIQALEDLSIRVTQAFFNAFLARANVENAKFNVSRNDSIYNISQGRYKLGTIAENDLLQTELELKKSNSSLVRSQIDFERSINNLKILLGYTTDVEFTLQVPNNLPTMYVDIEKAKQLAFKNNSEALNYKLSEIQADQNLARAEGEGGLSATIRASYGLNKSAEDFQDLYTDPSSSQFFTVGFDLPIFNWGKQHARVNAAINHQRQVQNSIQFQRRQFLQEVQFRVSEFLQLKDQAKLAAEADTIAQRRYFVAQKRYLIGKIDLTNLYIAQEEKDQARLAYIRALREYWVGLYSLRQLTLFNFREDKPITYNI